MRSADNLADEASRGIDLELIIDHKLWWHGPFWLSESLDPWPTVPDDLSAHTLLEVRKVKINLVSNVTT